MATTDYTLTDADVGCLFTPPDGFGVSLTVRQASICQTPDWGEGKRPSGGGALAPPSARAADHARGRRHEQNLRLLIFSLITAASGASSPLLYFKF